jgi:hypothetical protein
MPNKVVVQGKAPTGAWPKFIFVKQFPTTNINFVFHSADVRNRAAFEGLAIDGVSKTGYAAYGSGVTT